MGWAQSSIANGMVVCWVTAAQTASGTFEFWYHSEPYPLRGLLHGRAFKIALKPPLLLFDHRQH